MHIWENMTLEKCIMILTLCEEILTLSEHWLLLYNVAGLPLPSGGVAHALGLWW